MSTVGRTAAESRTVTHRPRRSSFPRPAFGLACLIWLALPHSADADSGSMDPAALAHFESAVRPLLLDRCAKCHGADRQRGGLRLDSRKGLTEGGDSGAAIVPGSAAESLLLQKLESKTMPPKGEPPLSDRQIAEIRKWIVAGAPMTELTAPAGKSERKEHWAFRRPDREAALTSLPGSVRSQLAASSPAGSVHPIDAFIDSQLAARKLTSAPRASRPTLVRRAYFDLLGLPPTPEQVDKFVNDESPKAWEALIDELLASQHYGERWGRHWLDVARYADSGGYETDMYYRNAWRYRDWVVKSFNDDKPYDRFVQGQIAGDELWPDNLELDGAYVLAPQKARALEAHVATGFYALGPQIHESGMDARKSDYERLTDWVDATGSAFLGVTLGCARCHDHKFDPFTQRDYYSLQAVFARSREVERPIVNAMEIADFKQHYPRILAVRAAREAYRQFEQTLAGRQPTPDEDAKRHELLQAIGRAVLDIPERAASSPGTPFDGLLEVPVISVLGHERPELVSETKVLHRGDLERPRDRVTPAIPQALAESMEIPPTLPDGPTSRRELALWLTRPDHPLTARVMVNRLWQWHFGRGLVSTPSDFGAMGQPPSHPALLDWLATEFVARGWSIKAMHRLIMTSQAYQRSSDFSSEAGLAADPDNTQLWRFHRRRLEAESVWDALHSVAATINLQIGGPPVVPPLSNEELAALRDRYRWIVSPDAKQHSRRGLYIVNYRNFRFPLFEVFDAPGSAVSAPGRDVSTVAPQSLWLLNNRTAWSLAQHLAARLVRDTGDQPSILVEKLWKIALGRKPDATELAEAVGLLETLTRTSTEAGLENAPAELKALPAQRAGALVRLCLGIFSHNEFLYID